jgi:hypothetical protein
MANLFSSLEISQYESAFNDIHESFSREVLVIKESKRIIIEELDSNYNYQYKGSKQKSVKQTEIPVSAVFKMRIYWNDPSKELTSPSDVVSSVRPKIHMNTCRLKMKKDAYDFIAEAKKIIVDGRTCEHVGFSKPHGIINNINFYTIILREVNEDA